jgi:MoxR-like ATPase
LPDDIETVIYSDKSMVKGSMVKALLDEHPDTMVLFDEYDKIPPGSSLEQITLQSFSEKCAITINELNKTIVPVTGRPPHFAITSNAGIDGMRSSLSAPIRRRGDYILVPEMNWERCCGLIAHHAPSLSPLLIRQIVQYVHGINEEIRLDKEISISETIKWAKAIEKISEQCLVEELNEAIILPTIYKLAKSQDDRGKVLLVTETVLKEMRRSKKVYLMEENFNNWHAGQLLEKVDESFQN